MGERLVLRGRKVAGARSSSAGCPRIKEGGWGGTGGLPRPLPSWRAGERSAAVPPTQSRAAPSAVSRSRCLARGAACRAQTSLPGSQDSPPPSPRPKIPANSGRGPAPPAPAPTPSSLLLLPSADAATAAPRAAASPQPRPPRSPPLPQAVGPESFRRRRAERRRRARNVRRAGQEGRRRPLRSRLGSAPESQVPASSLPWGRTQRTTGLAPARCSPVPHRERGNNTQGRKQRFLGTVVRRGTARKERSLPRPRPRRPVGVVVRLLLTREAANVNQRAGLC